MTDKTDTTALVIAEELNEWARDYAPTELATALATCAAVLLKKQNARIAELEALQAAPPAPAAVAVPDERQAFERYQCDRMRRDLQELTIHADGRYDCDDIQAEWEAWQARAALAAAPAQEHATQLAGQGRDSP